MSSLYFPGLSGPQKDWVKTHWRSEYHFLREHGLNIYKDDDRIEGQAIIQGFMEHDEYKSAADQSHTPVRIDEGADYHEYSQDGDEPEEANVKSDQEHYTEDTDTYVHHPIPSPDDYSTHGIADPYATSPLGINYEGVALEGNEHANSPYMQAGEIDGGIHEVVNVVGDGYTLNQDTHAYGETHDEDDGGEVISLGGLESFEDHDDAVGDGGYVSNEGAGSYDEYDGYDDGYDGYGDEYDGDDGGSDDY